MALSSNPDDNRAQPIEPSGQDLDDTNWLSQLETLESLAQIVREEKLGELDVRFGGARLKLKAPGVRSARNASSSPAPIDPAENDDWESPADSSTSAPVDLIETTGAVDANMVSVISPMVGLFYRAPSPNDPVFVSVGDHVEVGQTLGLIETMKVFNEITSEVEGTVAAIAFENGQLIETGDAIMTIRRA